MSWNIERGARAREILPALDGPLRADICLLQEVDVGTRRTGYRDVAPELARGLGMHYVLGLAFEELAQGRTGAPAFQGQALLSRFALSGARVLRFREQPHDWGADWKPRWAWLQPRRGGRMALVAEMDWGGRRAVLYDVHLESRASDRERAKQIQEVIEDVEAHYSKDTPVVIAGDLNVAEWERSPVVRSLEAAGFRDALRDFKGPLQTKVGANERNDWIFVRGLEASEGTVVPLRISDHYPLIVRLSLVARSSR